MSDYFAEPEARSERMIDMATTANHTKEESRMDVTQDILKPKTYTSYIDTHRHLLDIQWGLS
jgi:hypothetical protein